MSKCVAGSRSVAALLAAWTVQPGAISLTASATGRKARELLAEEVVVQLVRGGEVGPDAGQLEPLVVVGRRGRARSAPRGSRSPSLPMPLSSLT